jgi:hypothetical protein
MKANVTYKCSDYLLLDHFGVQGKGANITEATEDAGRKIERAVSADYKPWIMHFTDARGDKVTSVVYCDFGDYTVAVKREGKQEYYHGGQESKEEAIRYAKYNAAQDMLDTFDRSCLDRCFAILEQDQVYEFARYAEWQYLVRHYIDKVGLGPQGAQHAADRAFYSRKYPDGYEPIEQAKRP